MPESFLVEHCCFSAISIKALAVGIKGLDIVYKAALETHSFTDSKDELMCNAGESGAKIENDNRRELADNRVI